MNLTVFRKHNPEYEDLSDDELVDALKESYYSDLPTEHIVKLLEEFEEEVKEPEAYIKLLEEVKSLLISVREAVENISITVEAPVVNIPEIKIPTINVPKADAPIVNVQAPTSYATPARVVIPEAPKEWIFEVVRSRDGYIQNVVARAE